MISGPKQRAECVYVGVCLHIFSPPYGCDLVICYSMLAYSHTSGFLLLCGFLVCVDKVYFGWGQNLVWFFPLVLSSWVPCSFSVCPSRIYNLLLLCHLKNFLLVNSHRFDLLHHPVCDWPLDLVRRGRIWF